jgi:hypothetical protein
MNKREEYLAILRTEKNVDTFLLEHSNLPGPRSNLELADAAASIATHEQILHFLSFATQAPAEPNADEFLPVCGTIALGYELARGKTDLVPLLRHQANDLRWRVRESVAIALQIFGDSDIDQMLGIVREMANGTIYEQRAAVAAICEPRLLKKKEHASAALDVLDRITHSIKAQANRSSDEFKTLRKGLGYCWSVAVAALPEEGKDRFAAWTLVKDPDIRWILKENLTKNRLLKMDPGWVDEMRKNLE